MRFLDTVYEKFKNDYFGGRKRDEDEVAASQGPSCFGRPADY